MLQRDYLLKEIEKIASIVNTIRQNIFGGTQNFAITLENTKQILQTEINFDLDKFLDFDFEKSNEYICSFEGFSVENIEMLATCISEIGFRNQNENSEKYLEKALQLYELCNLKSKTFSIEREGKMSEIKNALVST